MGKYLAAIVFTLLVVAIPTRSQQPLVGLIEGKVADQNQTPVAHAVIVASNIDTVNPKADRRTASADSKGVYQFVAVPEGRYSIVISRQGYRDYRISEVTVRGGETIKIPDITMIPAGHS